MLNSLHQGEVMETSITKEVYSLKYYLQVTDISFRHLFLMPMAMLYALIAKLTYIVELLDFKCRRLGCETGKNMF